MSNDGAICWPEQFPGEYETAHEIWQKADERWPDRKRHCACSDNEPETPCHHCPKCGRFMSGIGLYGSDVGGMLAIVGTCKVHGEQCADMTYWDWEYFESSDD